MMRSSLRGRIRVLGPMIGEGLLGFADVLDELIAGPVLDTCRVQPELYDVLDAFVDELGDELSDAASAAMWADARARSPVQPRAGLPAYYPAIVEPRDQALARLRAVIFDPIAEAARIGAARRELHRRREAELPFLNDPSPAAKAALTKRLHAEVAAAFEFDRRIPVAPRVLVSGAQGIGKTALAAGAVAGIRERVAVRWTEPTLEKCDEAADAYAKAADPGSLPFLVGRGRAQPDPSRPGTAMCQRHEIADQVWKRGLSVTKTLCTTCPIAQTGCGYLEQRARITAMDGVGVFFTATASLFTASPIPAADILVGDERIDPTDVVKVPLAVLQPGVLPYRGGTNLAALQDAHRTLEGVHAALTQPHQLATLRAAGIGRDQVRAVVRLLEPEAEPDARGITGSLPDAEITKKLDAMEDRSAAHALTVLRAVLREIDQPRPFLHGVTLKAGVLTVSRLRRVLGIANAGALLLDGTGDPELNRAVFGARLRHEEVRIERDAHVTGTRGKGYSRQSVTGLDAKDQAMPAHQASSKRLRDEIAVIARRQPGPCLVVAPMAAETALADHLPQDTPTGHFNKLRGLNTWEDCRSTVSVGQNSLSVAKIEDLARCYLADDPEPFVSADVPMPEDWPHKGWPYYATRMRRMRDGSLSPVEVAVHPDLRVQRVYEQLREAEAIQAPDRTRPVFNHRKLVLMNNLVLDVTYDRELTHAELVAGGTRWDRAWAESGILPLGNRDLHAAHRKLFDTEKAAERALANTPPAQIRLLFEGRGYLFAYRRQGQRGRQSRVLIDLARHPDPRAALTALFGPLMWFEAVDPAQDRARPVAVPEAPPPCHAAQPPPAPVRKPALRLVLPRPPTVPAPLWPDQDDDEWPPDTPELVGWLRPSPGLAWGTWT